MDEVKIDEIIQHEICFYRPGFDPQTTLLGWDAFICLILVLFAYFPLVTKVRISREVAFGSINPDGDDDAVK